MRSKRTFTAAVILLTLISAARAEVILTFNGVDAAKEAAEAEGKDNFVIAVAGDSDIEASSYYIAVEEGAIEPEEEGYSFSFENELRPGVVRLVAGEDMLIDGSYVEEGEVIYELVLFYFSEKDIVIAFGANLGNLTYVEPKPSPVLESQATIESAAEFEEAVEAGAESFVPPAGRRSKRSEVLIECPEVAEDFDFLQMPEEWRAARGEFSADVNEGLRELSVEEMTFPPKDGEVCASLDGEEMLEGSDYIVIPDGTIITENTIWDCNYVYLEGDLYVENAMLVIKPGVKVFYIRKGCEGIIVRNNGCIIANGTAEERIYFWPYYPDEWGDYDRSILIMETASPLCEISYCTIGYAWCGIAVVNNRLETPIHDNSIWYCTVGIGQDGPKLTDVVNNEILHAEWIGIGIVMGQDGAGSSDTEILIENNSIAGWWFGGGRWGQSFGIRIYGVAEPNEAGGVTIVNNLIAGSRTSGISLVDGWMRPLWLSNGFYRNNSNMNIGDSGEEEAGDGGGGGEEALLGAPPEGGGEVNSITISLEDFETYGGGNPIYWKWCDCRCNYTSSWVDIVMPPGHPAFDTKSMLYNFENGTYPPHYSEAWVDIDDLPSGVGADWTVFDVNMLALYFHGQAGNPVSEQMYITLTDGDEDEFVEVDDFEAYGGGNPIYNIWCDWQCNGSCAEVYTSFAPTQPAIDEKGMWYDFMNGTYSPHYSEAWIDANKLPSGAGSDWAGNTTLSVWFHGQADNPVSEQMYITLKDGAGVEAKVEYGDMNDIRVEEWQEWAIALSEFNDVNLANVKRITIGFAKGAGGGADGTVYFDNIRLYPDYPPEVHSTTVYYEGHHKYELMEQWWHAWNVPLSEFNDVNLANVKRITIGFAKGAGGGADGTVYFDNIVLTSQPLVSDFSGPYSGTSVYLDDEDDPFVFGWGPGNVESWLLLDQNSMLIDRGFGYVDEYRDIIGKTTSYDCRPDSDRMDIGFHYPIWVFEELGSGELLSADLDYSMAVDFSDFAIFADYWQRSTAEEADLDGSGFVDYNDLALFAEEWQARNEMFIECFSLDGEPQPMDFNNVSGYACIVLRSIPLDAEKVFIYVDDVQIGSWVRGLNESKQWFGFESDRFLNGEHTIRLASENLEGEIVNYRLVNADFNNVMYKVSGGEHFHPDENYRYSGFYDGEEFLEAELTGLYDNVIWSNIYSGDYIDVNIPGSAFGTEKYCELNIAEAEGGMMATMQENGAAAMDGSSSKSKSLDKEFKKEDCAGTRMVIITPTKDIFQSRKPAIIACAEACEDRGVIWTPLHYRDVTGENLTYLYNMDSVKYIYWAGHAESHIGDVQRTRTGCWKSEPRRFWFDKWLEIYAFSWTRQTKANAQPLPDGWDFEGFDLWSLGMHESWNKKIVFIDGCKSAAFNDMARAYGVFSLEGQASKDQIYIGWREDFKQAVWDQWYDDTTAGVELFWKQMGQGNSAKAALQYTCDHYPSEKCWINMWGENMETDFFVDGGDDKIVLYGLGATAFHQGEIRLEP